MRPHLILPEELVPFGFAPKSPLLHEEQYPAPQCLHLNCMFATEYPHLL